MLRGQLRREEGTVDVGPPELIIILVLVLVLFGGKKLPELARSLGQAKKEFQKGSEDDAEQPPAAAEHAPGE
jgi:sec-independent protein translocase protein TatA